MQLLFLPFYSFRQPDDGHILQPKHVAVLCSKWDSCLNRLYCTFGLMFCVTPCNLEVNLSLFLIKTVLHKYIPALNMVKWYSNLRRSGCTLNYELPDRRRCQICRCTAGWLLTLRCQTPADICWCPQYPVVFPLAYSTSSLQILSCPILTNMIYSSQWHLCI